MTRRDSELYWKCVLFTILGSAVVGGYFASPIWALAGAAYGFCFSFVENVFDFRHQVGFDKVRKLKSGRQLIYRKWFHGCILVEYRVKFVKMNSIQAIVEIVDVTYLRHQVTLERGIVHVNTDDLYFA